MKVFLKQQLKNLLRWLAKATIQKYKPGVVAVTGSVGKTSTKEAIYTVLRLHHKVRVSRGNVNNEFGVPLTILGDWEKIGGWWFWCRVVCGSLLRLIVRWRYPSILIMEYAADRPGDIRYLIDIAKPHMGVVTAIGDIPVHVEFYSGPDEVAREKSRLVEALPAAGFAILNYDDGAVLDMKNKTRAHIMTYGFGGGAMVRLTSFEHRVEPDPKNSNLMPIGISFKIEYEGSFVPVRLNGVLGKTAVYAAGAAACIGIAYGLNLVKIADALHYYSAPDSRMKLLPGIKNTYIIDDSYNASPLSMHAAIDAVKQLKLNGRKIAVLGDMLEIGQYTATAHEAIGSFASKVFDILFTVGARAKFIAEAANSAGMAQKRILSFDTADEARLAVQQEIKEGDLILVKASRGIGLDKIVEEIRQL